MSKIAITPNASGTGTFTIAAPNSNTDRTLTLPDAAGAVVIDEAGGGSVKIDSSGNVGIGTSSPGRPLDVNGSIRFASGGIIECGGAGGLNTYLAAIEGGSGYWAFGTAAGERMRIDSAGRVTKPYQPMFSGFPTTDYSAGGMPTGVMSVTAQYNNGGHFNAANSRFTAPVTGWYLTTWGGLQLSTTITSIMVNGTRFISGNLGTFTGNYVTMTQTAIISLNAGDYLNIEQWNGGGYYNGWYIWSVTLLG